MTPRRHLHPLWPTAVIAAALLFTGTADAQTTTEASLVRAGTIKQVSGQAWISTARTPRRDLAPGDPVGTADHLHTGNPGAVSLVLRDGTALTLGPDSSLRLDEFRFDTTTQEGSLLLDLIKGSVRVVTGMLAKVNPEVFKLRTPTSVVGVRGTDFIVETQAAQ